MKKILLLAFAITSSAIGFSQCTDLFISEYVEGTGNDKAIELYNPTNAAISLTPYSIERFSNGQATSASGGVLQLTGSVAAHHTFVIVNGQTVDVTTPPSPKCSPALQSLANQLDGAYPAPCYFNGNDALVLFKTGATKDTVDIFAKIGDAAMISGYGWSDSVPYDGTTGKIWTENHTLIRKATVMKGVTSNPSTFIVTQEWDSLLRDTWTNLGSHTCNCPLGINDFDQPVSVVLYPNPSMNGFINISAEENIQIVIVYDLLGVEVSKREKESSKNLHLNLSALSSGIYFVKLGFVKDKSAVYRISIQ